MENPNNVKRSIRIPKELYEKVKKQAQNDSVSINKWIIKLIEKVF